MAAYFQSVDLLGFAIWMQIQAKKNCPRGKFLYIYSGKKRQGVLEQIGKPKTEWESPLAAFEDSLAHEEFVTSSLNELVNASLEEKDHATKYLFAVVYNRTGRRRFKCNGKL